MNNPLQRSKFKKKNIARNFHEMSRFTEKHHVYQLSTLPGVGGQFPNNIFTEN